MLRDYHPKHSSVLGFTTTENIQITLSTIPIAIFQSTLCGMLVTHTGKLQRNAKTATLGRVHSVHPSAGELYFFCILLHHEQSQVKVSWEDMCKVNGIQFDTFQATCRQLGLLHDDAEWNTVLEDAALISMCQQMHELFVTLLLFCNPAEPAVLFEQYNPQMGDDFIRRVQARGSAEPTDAKLCTMVLINIEQCLQSVGRQLRDFYLPSVDSLMRVRVSQLDAHMRLGQLSCELREELLYDAEVEQEKVDEWMGMLTSQLANPGPERNFPKIKFE